MTQEEQMAADKRLYVSIFRAPVLDQLATDGGEVHEKHPAVARFREEGREILPSETPHHVLIPPAGRPVYKEVDFIRIMRPSDRDNIPIRPIEEADKRRFPLHWQHYQENHESEGFIGTPLAELGFITVAQREEYAYFGVKSVEQLLAMAQEDSAKLPYFSQHRAKAERWLAARDGTSAAKQVSDVERMQVELAALRKANEELKARLDESPKRR
jgi:hypothetical protein